MCQRIAELSLKHLVWHAEEFWRPYFFYVGLSALYALFAAGTVAFWAPEAAGSGMPEIKVCYSPHILTLDGPKWAISLKSCITSQT